MIVGHADAKPTRWGEVGLAGVGGVGRRQKLRAQRKQRPHEDRAAYSQRAVTSIQLAVLPPERIARRNTTGEAAKEAERDPIGDGHGGAAQLGLRQDHQVRVGVRRDVVDVEAGDKVAVAKRTGIWQQAGLGHPCGLGQGGARDRKEERRGSDNAECQR